MIDYLVYTELLCVRDIVNVAAENINENEKVVSAKTK